jgi:hypothetical protein
VTRTAAAKKQLSKHVSAEKKTRINRTVFSVRSVPRGYKKDNENRLSETPACQDVSLGAEELKWGIEASELLSAVDFEVRLSREDFMCNIWSA